MRRKHLKKCGISSRARTFRSLKAERNHAPVVALASPNVALQTTREILYWSQRLLTSDHLALLRPLPAGGANARRIGRRMAVMC
jgi:hypothetical protein